MRRTGSDITGAAAKSGRGGMTSVIAGCATARRSAVWTRIRVSLEFSYGLLNVCDAGSGWRVGVILPGRYDESPAVVPVCGLPEGQWSFVSSGHGAAVR